MCPIFSRRSKPTHSENRDIKSGPLPEQFKLAEVVWKVDLDYLRRASLGARARRPLPASDGICVACQALILTLCQIFRNDPTTGSLTQLSGSVLRIVLLSERATMSPPVR